MMGSLFSKIVLQVSIQFIDVVDIRLLVSKILFQGKASSYFAAWEWGRESKRSGLVPINRAYLEVRNGRYGPSGIPYLLRAASFNIGSVFRDVDLIFLFT